MSALPPGTPPPSLAPSLPLLRDSHTSPLSPALPPRIPDAKLTLQQEAPRRSCRGSAVRPAVPADGGWGRRGGRRAPLAACAALSCAATSPSAVRRKKKNRASRTCRCLGDVSGSSPAPARLLLRDKVPQAYRNSCCERSQGNYHSGQLFTIDV